MRNPSGKLQVCAADQNRVRSVTGAVHDQGVELKVRGVIVEDQDVRRADDMAEVLVHTRCIIRQQTGTARTNRRGRAFIFRLSRPASIPRTETPRAQGEVRLRILLVEDEASAARMLAKGLREQAYAVDVSPDGEDALYRLSINDYDLVILDVMLPRKNGLEVCREMRSSGSSLPVLMLTARDAVSDRVAGLDTGADDYLNKPFDFQELLARVRALLRRGPVMQTETIEIADLVIDTQARRARRAGRPVELTSKEFSLLEYLARHADKVVNRSQIAEHVWDENFDVFSNLIEVYMQRLRRKIDDGHSCKLLRTMRGEGYMLTAGED